MSEVEQLLCEILNCPRNTDVATIPKEGLDIENEKHRKQLVCMLSVSYDRLWRIERYLETQQKGGEGMMTKNRIEKGDRVKATFGQGGYFDDIEGVVDYTPCAEGDSWVLVQDDGRVIYVQRFETMILLSKPNADLT